MAGDAVQLEILRQLAEIQRHLGQTTSTVEALREELLSQSQDTSAYRNTVEQSLANASTRLGQVEADVKTLKQVMEKTVQPLVSKSNNMQQRVIGFTAAVSLVAAAVSALFWFFGSALPQIIQYLSKAAP